MTQTQHKLRAVILAALMVLSVFAIAFAGTAGAANRQLGGDSQNDLENNTVIFQGETLTESDITGVDSAQISSVEEFTTDSGEIPLVLESGEIPQDQQTGIYTTPTDATLIVRSPTISDLEIFNGNNEDVAGGNLLIGDKMNVSVGFNFATAENITVSVENEAGVDVTSQFFNNTSVDASELQGDGENVVHVDAPNETAVFTVFASSADGPDLRSWRRDPRPNRPVARRAATVPTDRRG
jgi:surface glycoprotein (TIGR04207 family)